MSKNGNRKIPLPLILGLATFILIILLAIIVAIISKKHEPVNVIEKIVWKTNEISIFLEELDRQIEYQYRWELVNRNFGTVLNSLSWLLPLLVTTISFYLAGGFAKLKTATVRVLHWIIAIVTALSLSIPYLNSLMRFQQRQQVYDQMAKEYESIKLELITNRITLDVAIYKFNKIHLESPEERIRKIP